MTVRTSVRRGPGQPLGGSFGAASIGLWLRRRAFAAPLLVLGLLLGAPTAATSSPPTESASATAASGVGEGWNGFGGGSLPGPEWRPYAATSPFNTEVGSSPQIAANSSAVVARILSMQSNPPESLQAGNEWEHPIYWALPGDPEREVVCVEQRWECLPGGTRIKVPAVAVPATGSDHHFAIVEPDGTEYDFWNASLGTGTISSPVANKTSITGSGLGGIATAAGFNLAAGIILPAEFLAGKINHALFAVVHECAGHVYPATHDDCGSGENLPAEGTHLWLAMSDAQIEALHLPKWKEGVVKALAHYGAYVGDKGGSGFNFQLEDEHPWTAFGESAPLSGSFNLSEGVEWAKYLRVLAPPSESPPPGSEPSPKINTLDPGLTETRFPDNIAIGADGNLWVTGHERASIDKITPGGAASEFFLAPGSTPDGIVAGPDGNLWFSEFAGRIGRITPAGVLQEFSNGISGHPTGITTGPDGNLWFPETDGKIGRITTEGALTEFSTGITSRYFDGITAGPDGNLWFMESGGMIGRITTAGVVTEFSTDLGGPSDGPLAIARGPDGNIWFAENGRIGRITTEGVVTLFSAGLGNAAVYSLASGPDGNLWFAESDGAIGRITTSGDVTTFHENVGGVPLAITPGREGDLWFTEESGQVGRVLP